MPNSIEDIASAFMGTLPSHKCSLHLTHNQHLSYYETVEAYLGPFEEGPSFQTEIDRQECFKTNEIWELQWYPDTPVGSYSIAAPTLVKLLSFAAVALDRDSTAP